jgi:hypothetical protein
MRMPRTSAVPLLFAAMMFTVAAVRRAVAIPVAVVMGPCFGTGFR